MERGSDKHGRLRDEAMKAEVQGAMKAERSTHVEEWRDPEPSGEDQPDVSRVPDGTFTGGVPDGMAPEDVEGRNDLARSLDRADFPADKEAVLEAAARHHAPDRVIETLRRLPDGEVFTSVGEVWQALGGGSEQHRF
ncbi:MAG: DUF2795 domain-containing protein [Acidothermales bacterium]|jgi:hypothetical protein|nr:DUF2795 domain-containing protein [Acidothermales bacterium]